MAGRAAGGRRLKRETAPGTARGRQTSSRSRAENAITETGGTKTQRPASLAPSEMAFLEVSSLRLSEDNRGDHRLGSTEPGRPENAVAVEALDAIPSLWERRLDVLKIDVQGAEVQVFRGLPGLLAANPQIRMISEFWPHGLADIGDSIENLFHALDSRPTNIWFVESALSMRRTTAVELIELAHSTYRPEVGWHADMVLLHAEDDAGRDICDDLSRDWTARIDQKPKASA